jgi:hypothetical protein
MCRLTGTVNRIHKLSFRFYASKGYSILATYETRELRVLQSNSALHVNA